MTTRMKGSLQELLLPVDGIQSIVSIYVQTASIEGRDNLFLILYEYIIDIISGKIQVSDSRFFVRFT